jgi:hypothetical protein
MRDRRGTILSNIVSYPGSRIRLSLGGRGATWAPAAPTLASLMRVNDKGRSPRRDRLAYSVSIWRVLDELLEVLYRRYD